ncbi:Branched-chain amino acid transportATP-bindingprotein LivF [Enterococcus sp. HSIEG1]|nr:Branched-chain amino acid transportATP-bindingprotein LivF [Enterococcus sp. HSIEG1]
MLRIENLSVHYGMIQAVHDVSFEVNQGEIVSLIGANGAGKTTILRTISGLIRPSKGTILFEGKPIQKEAPQKIVANGLSQVPEGRHVFQDSPFKKTLRWALFCEKTIKSKRTISRSSRNFLS